MPVDPETVNGHVQKESQANRTVISQKKEVSSTRAADQKAIDKSLLANIKKVEFLASYLASSFSLRKGDKPHEMKW